MSETELLGAPPGGEAWHKLQSRRALTVLAHLEDVDSRARLQAWLITVSSWMRLHSNLARAGAACHALLMGPP